MMNKIRKEYKLLTSLDTNCIRVKNRIKYKDSDSILIFITPTVEKESNCHYKDVKRFSDIYEELKIDKDETKEFEKIINEKYIELIKNRNNGVQPNDVKIIVESAFLSTLFKRMTYLVTKDFKMRRYGTLLRKEDKFFERLITIKPKNIGNYI